MESILNIILSFVVYIVPFLILYFVVAAGVKKGIDSSEAGRAILEKHHERKTLKK
ncbi:hypothetical protein [Oceanobacillus sp. CAU 1775]